MIYFLYGLLVGIIFSGTCQLYVFRDQIISGSEQFIVCKPPQRFPYLLRYISTLKTPSVFYWTHCLLEHILRILECPGKCLVS